jgi:uncharacterized membrane protein YhfC
MTELYLVVAGVLCTFGPIAVAIYWHRRTSAPYLAFLAGGLIFIVFQLVLRLPWQIPLALWAKEQRGIEIVFFAFSAFTAGLFEEVGRYLGFKFLLRRDQTVATATMYGLGHGGTESALLVGLSFLALALASELSSRGLIADPLVVGKVQMAMTTVSGSTLLAAVLERVAAVVLNVGLSLTVLQAITRKQVRWVVLAIAIHALVDFLAVLLARHLKVDIFVVEAIMISMALATLGLGISLSRRSLQSITRLA